MNFGDEEAVKATHNKAQQDTGYGDAADDDEQVNERLQRERETEGDRGRQREREEERERCLLEDFAHRLSVLPMGLQDTTPPAPPKGPNVVHTPGKVVHR